MTRLVPPQARSVPALGLLRGAAEGRFALQRCGCGAVLYPVRDACPACLSQDLPFVDVPAGGVLLTETTIHAASDPWWRGVAPIRQGLVRGDCGATLVALVHRDCAAEGRVRLSLKLDRAGGVVVWAVPEGGAMTDDPVLAEFTLSPKGRRFRLSGEHPLMADLAIALEKAGAALVDGPADVVIHGGDARSLLDLPVDCASDGLVVLAAPEGFAARPDNPEVSMEQAALRGAALALRGRGRVAIACIGALDRAKAASGLIAALSQGVEDIWLGSDAQALREACVRDPKAAERFFWG